MKHILNSIAPALLKSIASCLYGALTLPVFILAITIAGNSYAQDTETVQLIRPAEGGMVYSKKPEIECKILIPFDKETLSIEFNYTDLTGLAKITDTGFVVRPVQVVDPGDHNLIVSFANENGEEIVKEFQFSTRHTKTFETMYSKNKITANYNTLINRQEDAKDRDVNDWTMDANINSRNIIGEGPWEFGFETNLRYQDQDHEFVKPEESGWEFMDFLFTGQYEQDTVLVNAALGDVLIDESRNTVNNLSRRGGSISAQVGPVYGSGFVVRSDMPYGWDGDYGLEFEDRDHIYGGAAGLELFDDRLDLKAITVTGGELGEDESYGIWPQPGGNVGETHGIQVRSDFFDQKFTTKFEWDESKFDSDTSDDIVTQSDNAWYAEIGGTIDIFSYDASYERTGPRYQVPGNDSIQEDWEGYTISPGLAFETQSIMVTYAMHNDNIDDDPSRPVTDSREIGIDYTLDAISWLPMSFSWNQAMRNSTKEPAGSTEIKSYTDTLSSTISYRQDAWELGLAPEFTAMDDKTAENYDTDAHSLTLFYTYANDRFSISPSVTGNRFKDYTTGIRTYTYTYSLSWFLNIIGGFNFEGNGNYTKQYDSNDELDQDDWNADVQLSYTFESPIKGLLTPSISLHGSYVNNCDEISDTDSKETLIFLLISADLDLSF